MFAIAREALKPSFIGHATPPEVFVKRLFLNILKFTPPVNKQQEYHRKGLALIMPVPFCLVPVNASAKERVYLILANRFFSIAHVVNF